MARLPVRDVLDQALDEREGAERRYPTLAALALVFVAESDVVTVIFEDPRLAKGWPASIPAAIGQGLSRVIERGTDMHVPVEIADETQQGVHVQLSALVAVQPAAKEGFVQMLGFDEVTESPTPFDLQFFGAHPGMFAGVNEMLSIGGEASRGGQDVQMGVPIDAAAKGVQSDQKAGHVELAGGPYALASDSGKGFGTPASQGKHGVAGGLEKQGDQAFPIVLNQEAQLEGDRQHEVVVGHGQQVRQQFGTPSPGAGGAATGAEGRLAAVGDDTAHSAIRTAVGVKAQLGGATGQRAPDVILYRLADRLARALSPNQKGCPPFGEDRRDADLSTDGFHG